MNRKLKGSERIARSVSNCGASGQQEIVGFVLITVGAPSLKISGILLILVGIVFVALAIYTIVLAQRPGYGLAYVYLPMHIIISLVFIIPGIYLVRKQPQVEGKTN